MGKPSTSRHDYTKQRRPYFLVLPHSHTPGPWVSEPCGHSDKVDVWCASGIGHIAAVSTGLKPDTTAKANARLIAAAPDLLECLIHLAKKDWFNEGMTGEVICGLNADKVRAAITKATGKEPS